MFLNITISASIWNTDEEIEFHVRVLFWICEQTICDKNIRNNFIVELQNDGHLKNQ